eukprot:2679989-Prymnesium_polylepis.1
MLNLLCALLSATGSPGTRVGPKYMLLDDRNVHWTDAAFVLGAVEKHGAVISEERDCKPPPGFELAHECASPPPRLEPKALAQPSDSRSPPRRARSDEMRFDNMQPNVWYDPKMSRWRAWYSSFTNCSKAKDKIPMCNNVPQQCGSATPSTSYSEAGRGEALLYAESDDGITWRKPDLGLIDWKGSKANNLIELDGMTTQVYLDEAAP